MHVFKLGAPKQIGFLRPRICIMQPLSQLYPIVIDLLTERQAENVAGGQASPSHATNIPNLIFLQLRKVMSIRTCNKRTLRRASNWHHLQSAWTAPLASSRSNGLPRSRYTAPPHPEQFVLFGISNLLVRSVKNHHQKNCH